MNAKGYLGQDGTITLTTSDCDGAGKVLVLPSNVRQGWRVPAALFLAHVTVGAVVIAAPECYVTRAKCRESAEANLTHPFEVREHKVVASLLENEPILGLFHSKHAEMDENGITIWTDIITSVAIQDIPAGIPLDCAQLTGTTLELYFESGVLAATVRI
jgi:hypothetical protein